VNRLPPQHQTQHGNSKTPQLIDTQKPGQPNRKYLYTCTSEDTSKVQQHEYPMTRPILAYNEEHHLHDGLMNENAGRVQAIVSQLKRSGGMWEKCQLLTAAPSATDVVEVLHSTQHLATLQSLFAATNSWFCGTCTLENAETVAACEACGMQHTDNATSQHREQYFQRAKKASIFVHALLRLPSPIVPSV
jgi:hypothetical protein